LGREDLTVKDAHVTPPLPQVRRQKKTVGFFLYSSFVDEGIHRLSKRPKDTNTVDNRRVKTNRVQKDF
jgi:hypothetical protein